MIKELEKIKNTFENVDKDKVVAIDTNGIDSETVVDYLWSSYNKEYLRDKIAILQAQTKIPEEVKIDNLMQLYQQDEKILTNVIAHKINITIEADTDFIDFLQIGKINPGDIERYQLSKVFYTPTMTTSSDGVSEGMFYSSQDTLINVPYAIERKTPIFTLPAFSPVINPKYLLQEHQKLMYSCEASLKYAIDRDIQAMLDAGVGVFPANAVDYAPGVNTSLVPTSNLLVYSTGGELTKTLFQKIDAHFNRLSAGRIKRVMTKILVPLDAPESLWNWVSVVNSSNVVADQYSYAKNTISQSLQEQLEKTGVLFSLFGKPISIKANNTLPSGVLYVKSNLPAGTFDTLSGVIPQVWSETVGNQRFRKFQASKYYRLFQAPPHRLNYLKVIYS